MGLGLPFFEMKEPVIHDLEARFDTAETGMYLPEAIHPP